MRNSNNYLDIYGIKIAQNNPFLNSNNTLDTSGKIDEKIKLNTYHYIVNKITNDISQATDEIIFYYDDITELYSLQKKVSSDPISYEIIEDLNLSSSVFIKDIENIYILKNIDNTEQIQKQYWHLSSDFDPAQQINLTHELISLTTTGNVIVDKKLNSDSIETHELIVGEIQPHFKQISAELPYQFIFYGPTDPYTYFAYVEIIDAPTQEDPNHKNYKFHFYYLDNKTLDIYEIYTDINYLSDRVISAFIYNNILYIVAIYIAGFIPDPEDPSKEIPIIKYRILAYNTYIKVYDHKYEEDEFETPEVHGLVFFQAAVFNNNDVYIISNIGVYIILFINNIPKELTFIYHSNDQQYPYIIDKQIKGIQHTDNYIYIFCEGSIQQYNQNREISDPISDPVYNTKLYVYDIINNTLEYYYFDYSAISSDTNFEPNYVYSTINNNIVYIKFSTTNPNINLNNIYKISSLDSTNHICVIDKFIFMNSIEEFNEKFNNKIVKFNIIDTYIYLLVENTITQNETTMYTHTFYLYFMNIPNSIYILIYDYYIEDEYYTRPMKYESILPIDLSYYDVEIMNILNWDYPVCRLSLPFVNINPQESVINSLAISNKNITMLSENVNIPNNLINKSLISANITVKNNSNPLYITEIKDDLHKIPVKKYFKTSKCIFTLKKEANCESINCYLIPSIDRENNNPEFNIINSETEIMQSAFVYDDLLYVLCVSIINPNNPYFKICDIEKSGSNNEINYVKSVSIIQDSTQFYTINEHFFDENIIINDNLYIYNSNPNNNETYLFKCNLKQNILSFEYLHTFTNLQYSLPVGIANNTNYSTVKQLFNIDDKLLLVYYKNVNGTIDISDIEKHPIIDSYHIKVLDLNNISDVGYDIDLKVPTDNHNNSETLTVYNYGVFNDDTLYINIIDENTKGIYYINDFSQPELVSSEHPRELILLDLFKTDAYLFNVVKDNFYVITIQNSITEPTPGQSLVLQKFYINYYNRIDNITQSEKFIESTVDLQYGLLIHPIIFENREIFSIDSNGNYYVTKFSLHSSMFTNDLSVINNTAVFTTEQITFQDNMIITNSQCSINTEPINNNDITTKKYVDNLVDNIKSEELILTHTEDSLSTYGNIYTNGGFYTTKFLIGDIFKYSDNPLSFESLYYCLTYYNIYFIEREKDQGVYTNTYNLYKMVYKTFEFQKVDTLENVISMISFNGNIWVFLPNLIIVYNDTVRINIYTNINGYDLIENYTDFYKSILVKDVHFYYL